MPRRYNPPQFKSELRRAVQKQQQAVNNYNAAVRKYNSDRKRAVDSYNREVRAHDARVRSNQQRLQQEMARLRASSQTTRRLSHQQRVQVVHRSFQTIESSANAGSWRGGADLFDMSEGEAANSLSVLNTLLSDPVADLPDAWKQLQVTSIAGELLAIGSDLVQRWKGALY